MTPTVRYQRKHSSSPLAQRIKLVALRLLKIRPRSIFELRQKLELKGFDTQEIEVTIGDLIASGLLDDRALTKAFINYRLARPFGFRRIRQELRAKGIDLEMIEEIILELEEYSPLKVAQELAERRWQHMPASLDINKKKKRVTDFLLRRGFEADIVINVIKKLP